MKPTLWYLSILNGLHRTTLHTWTSSIAYYELCIKFKLNGFIPDFSWFVWIFVNGLYFSVEMIDSHFDLRAIPDGLGPQPPHDCSGGWKDAWRWLLGRGTTQRHGWRCPNFGGKFLWDGRGYDGRCIQSWMGLPNNHKSNCKSHETCYILYTCSCLDWLFCTGHLRWVVASLDRYHRTGSMGQ